VSGIERRAPYRLQRMLTSGLAALLCAGAGAQTRTPQAASAPPNDADVARMLERHRDEFEQARQAGAAAAGNPASRWNHEALPQPAPASAVDIGAIARGFDAQVAQQAQNVRAQGTGLLVFVSFSMPDESLRRLVGQVARVRGRVLLRGLVGDSLQQTVVHAQRVIGQQKAGLSIDPEAFQAFDVQAVPTFVLTRGNHPRGCREAACAADSVSVTGDVTLAYALDHIAQASPAFAAEAAALRAALQPQERVR
jgi:conjugal transfer pilus assembly protein TrbC